MNRWLAIGCLAASVTLIAGCGGATSSDSPDAVETAQPQSQDQGIVVGESLLDFVNSLSSYTRIEPDLEDPLSKFQETRTAFLKVKTDYLNFKDALALVTVQDQLGPNGPELEKLEALIPVADKYISTQETFFDSVGECADLPGGLSSPDCDVESLTRLEDTARDAIPPFVEAMDTVMESISQSSQ